jgi:hypothetical protein
LGELAHELDGGDAAFVAEVADVLGLEAKGTAESPVADGDFLDEELLKGPLGAALPR